ncbi:MAG: DUF5606 domain-containing protein [Flavobacteriales bacterium]|nr:DUF5606 domain-containing protein [Bacteroidota bacterium]MCB9239895.1 DUF5606 domain-containing protein [Flavobacteriales bacterium]
MASLELKDIVSISGKPGLNKIVGQRPNGLIVEVLDGSGKRFPTSIHQKVSILADISMYTEEGDAPLMDVLRNLHKEVEGGLELITKKSAGDDIRAFFRKVLPTFDEERVYNSDIIKLCSWYAILKDHLDFNAKPEKSDEADSEKESKASAPKSAAKPKKPAATKAKASAKSAPAKAPKITQRKMS